MPRPRIPRRVYCEPDVVYFKPAGITMRELEEITLTVTEYEAIRLKDLEDMDQTEAAKKMGISQPTLNRILTSGRKKLANAIVNGKAIRIHGGHFKVLRGRGRHRGKG